MSTDNKEGITASNEVVTDEVLAFVMDKFAQQQEEKRAREFASFMAGIKQELEPIASLLSNHDQILRRAMQQGAPSQEQGQQGDYQQQQQKQKLNIKDLVAEGREVVAALKEAGIIKGQPEESPIDARYQMGLQQNLNKLYNRSLQVAWVASENLLRKEISGVTKGLAKELVSGEGVTGHEPVF